MKGACCPAVTSWMDFAQEEIAADSIIRFPRPFLRLSGFQTYPAAFSKTILGSTLSTRALTPCSL